VLAGDLRIKAAPNGSPGQLVAQIDRLLPANLPVTAVIDGRQSNVIPPRIERIEPTQAAPADEVTLIGAGLSGRVVSVSFGATVVPIGSQPFSSRMRTVVPNGMSAGSVAVKATIDGHATNSVPFQVMS
jgi:hypothetical protein